MNSTAPETRLSSAGVDLAPPSASQHPTLEGALTRAERRVPLNHGTEAAFCGGLLDTKQAGTYCCRLCGLPLFAAPGTHTERLYVPLLAAELEAAAQGCAG